VKQLEPDARVIAIIVATVALGIAIAAIPNWPVGVFQDDGIYVILGKSLAAGEGYRYTNLPGAPYATHYPPGYPLLLALLWRIAPEFPQNIAVFTFTNAGLLAVAAYATFRFAHGRLGLGALGAGIVAVAGTASVPALSFGVFVLSEPLFMALLLPTLMLAERAAERGEWREAALAGVAGGVLAMVRTTGMFVVPALILVLLVRRRWVPAIGAATACAAFVVPWNLWVAANGAAIPRALIGKYGPYDTWLADAVRARGLPFVWEVVERNAQSLYGMTWAMFGGGSGSPTVLHLPVAICAALVLAAGARRLARRAPVSAWFLVAYMALVMVWPFEPVRFVWALLPIFGAMFALGVAAVVDWKPASALPGLARLAAVGVCATLVAGFAAYNLAGVRQQWGNAVPRQTAARATPVVEWVRAFTRPTDVIAMEDDALIYLYTGRKGIPVGTLTAEEYLEKQTYAFATEQLHAIIASYRPTYVIGTTSYAVMAARTLSERTPPALRVHGLLPTAAIFTPVTP
jgi:hypothetical protein